MSFNIVALGYCALEHRVVLPRIPAQGEDVKIKAASDLAAGPSCTAACAAAAKGKSVLFASVLGDDGTSHAILGDLKSRGVDTSGVVLRPGARSPYAQCWIDGKTGRRAVAWDDGSALPLAPGELPRADIRHADLLLLDGHHTAAAEAAAELALAHSVHVALCMDYPVYDVERQLELADIIVLPCTCALALTRQDSPEAAAKALFDKGNTSYVAVTGDSFVLGYDGKNLVRKDIRVNETFAGVFLACFLTGQPFGSCLTLSCNECRSSFTSIEDKP